MNSMKRSLIVLIIVLMQWSTGHAQNLFSHYKIDTLNAFSLAIIDTSGANFQYTVDWEFEEWKPIGDTLKVDLPFVLHIRESSTVDVFSSYNFPNTLDDSWHATVWEDEVYYNIEMLNQHTRRHLSFYRDSIEKDQIWDSLHFSVEKLPENTVYQFDGMEPLDRNSEIGVAKIYAGYMLYHSGMQDFRPQPLFLHRDGSTSMNIIWEAKYGEFEPQEGDLHPTGKIELLESYIGSLSAYFGWNFSGYRVQDQYQNLTGRYIWGEPVFQSSEETQRQFLTLYQVMANTAHQKMAQESIDQFWKPYLSLNALYGGQSYKNWEIFFKDWKNAQLEKHRYLFESITENNEIEKMIVHRFRGDEGSIFIDGIISDTMLYEIDMIKGSTMEVEVLSSKNFEFDHWENLDYEAQFVWEAENRIELTPVFSAKNVRNYRTIKTLKSKNIFKELTSSFPTGYLVLVIVIVAGSALLIFRA